MAEETPPQPPTKEELKAAMKVMRLDEESRVGRNPLSTGRSSDIVAITPPSGHAPAVWDELVRQGKLKRDRHGTYELGDAAS
jgi:hypothetical protein